MRRVQVIATWAALVLLGGCGSSSSTSSSSVATTSSTTTSAPAAGSSSAGGSSTTESTSSSPSSTDLTTTYTCVQPAEAKRLSMISYPGGSFAAYQVGTGKVGVVLHHQLDGDLCQWHDYANTLASKGYRVIVPENGTWQVAVVTAGAGALAKAGASSVVFMGASRGGTMALLAAADYPHTKAAVALSAPATYFDADAKAAVAKLTCPVFIAAGAGDTEFAPDAQALTKAATKSSKVVSIVVPGDSRHGVALLSGGTQVSKPLEQFLSAYAPPRS